MKTFLLTTALSLSLAIAPASAQSSNQQSKQDSGSGGGAGGVVIVLLMGAGLLGLGGGTAKSISEGKISMSELYRNDDHRTSSDRKDESFSTNNNDEEVEEWGESFGKPLPKKPGSKPSERSEKREDVGEEKGGDRRSPARKRVEVETPYWIREYTEAVEKIENGTFNQIHAAFVGNLFGDCIFNSRSYLYRGWEYGVWQITAGEWEVEVRGKDGSCFQEVLGNQDETHEWAENAIDSLMEEMGKEAWQSLKAPSGAVKKKEPKKSRKKTAE